MQPYGYGGFIEIVDYTGYTHRYQSPQVMPGTVKITADKIVSDIRPHSMFSFHEEFNSDGTVERIHYHSDKTNYLTSLRSVEEFRQEKEKFLALLPPLTRTLLQKPSE